MGSVTEVGLRGLGWSVTGKAWGRLSLGGRKGRELGWDGGVGRA